MSGGATVEPRWLRGLETLACAALLAMLVITVADVLGRYVVSRPVKGVTELVQYAMVVVIFAGLPVVTARQQHISVGLLGKAFKGAAERVRVGLIASVSAAILAVQAWLLFDYAQGMRESADVIGALRLPVHPAGYFMALLSAVAAVLCVVAALRPAPAAQGPAH